METFVLPYTTCVRSFSSWSTRSVNACSVDKFKPTFLGRHSAGNFPWKRQSRAICLYAERHFSVQCSLDISGKGDKSWFFNRTREINILSNGVFRGPSKFTVLLGPPSSGKTALIQQIVELNGFSAISVNLRGLDMSSEENFLLALLAAIGNCGKLSTQLKSMETAKPPSGVLRFFERTLNSIWSTWSKAQLSQSLKRVTLEGAKLGFEFTAEELTVSGVLEKLGKAVAELPSGDKPILLIVDEANRFQAFAERNSSVLDAILSYVVQISKERDLMHVVFTSSDNYFDQWLINKGVDEVHFQLMVLGDLTYDEAYDYYLQELSSLGAKMQALLYKEKKDFAEVFNLTGGRMMFIKSYVQQVSKEGPIISPVDFRPIQNELFYLERELSRLPAHLGGYDRQSLLKVFRLLTTDSRSYLTLKEAADEFGFCLTELISRNILIFRPPSGISYDLQPKPDGTVVTAKSQPALRAMGLLLDKYSDSNL